MDHPTRAHFPLPALFATAIALSAFLLFWLQPLFTKAALPILGGGPNVWNAALVCFQVFLLAGYWYADRVTSLMSPGRQAAIHTLMVLAALAWIWSVPLLAPTGTEAYRTPVTGEL